MSDHLFAEIGDWIRERLERGDDAHDVTRALVLGATLLIRGDYGEGAEPARGAKVQLVIEDKEDDRPDA